jgi:hypothetical protein
MLLGITTPGGWVTLLHDLLHEGLVIQIRGKTDAFQ